MTQPTDKGTRPSRPRSPKLEQRRKWWGETSEKVKSGDLCSRCFQPVDGIDWEAVEENGSGNVVAVCADCLTPEEQQAIDDAAMQLSSELDTDLGQLPVSDADIERISRTAYGCELAFDRLANLVTLAIEDAEKAQTQLPAYAGLWDHVDLVRAARHLRVAARLVDSVADRIVAPAVSQ